MNNHHITELLDSKPFAGLSDSELVTIRSHVADCAECQQAFEVARISALLLKERAAEAAQNAVNANPFFQTRVMAAWREQQANAGWSFRRLWSATGALVASMAVTTAALAAFAVVTPSTEPIQTTAAMVPYSAESVMLDQSDDDQVTEDQVINAMYADDEDK